ncbi:hypothetical protein CRM22_008929, partial [Opisthorchis felineus]
TCNDEERSRCLSRHYGDSDEKRKCWKAHYDRCKGQCEPDSDGCFLLCEVFSRPKVTTSNCDFQCNRRSSCLHDLHGCKTVYISDSDTFGMDGCRDNCNKEQTSRCKFIPGQK